MRVLDNYEDGLITREQRNEKLAAIDAQLAAAGRSAVVEALPGAIDWGWPVEDVNRLLRLLVERIDVGADMRSVSIVPRGRIAEWVA